jgi:hypothetical protein
VNAKGLTAVSSTPTVRKGQSSDSISAQARAAEGNDDLRNYQGRVKASDVSGAEPTTRRMIEKQNNGSESMADQRAIATGSKPALKPMRAEADVGGQS